MNEQPKKVPMNPVYKQVWNCPSRYLLLYGSRSSGKSDFVALQIINNLMTWDYYSLISVRKTYESIMESSFRTLVDKIEALDLEQEFVITKSPLKIVCKRNNNQVIFRGLDDTSKLRSIKDPSAIHYEEDVPDTYEEYLTVSLSLRGSKSKYLQEIFTFNPVMDDYENHWLWRRFFKGQDKLSFTTIIEDEIDGKIVRETATVLQTTWRENMFLSPQDRLTFKSLEGDPVAYAQQSLGIFCNKIAHGQAYSKFKYDLNTKENFYDPSYPLHISFDFNTKPYNTAIVFQGIGKQLYQIDEICLEPPNNNTKDLCDEIQSRYGNHKGGMYIYGDSSGFQDSTKSERGYNDYAIIFKELARYHPTNKTTRSNPSVKMRIQFINQMFLGRIEALQEEGEKIGLWINKNCKKTILDYLNVKEKSDGTKLKEKFKNKETGESYERYAHISDAIDYIVCQYFIEEYSQYLSGASKYFGGNVVRKHRSSNY